MQNNSHIVLGIKHPLAKRHHGSRVTGLALLLASCAAKMLGIEMECIRFSPINITPNEGYFTWGVGAGRRQYESCALAFSYGHALKNHA